MLARRQTAICHHARAARLASLPSQAPMSAPTALAARTHRHQVRHLASLVRRAPTPVAAHPNAPNVQQASSVTRKVQVPATIAGVERFPRVTTAVVKLAALASLQPVAPLVVPIALRVHFLTTARLSVPSALLASIR